MRAWMIAAAGLAVAGGAGMAAQAKLEGGYTTPTGATVHFDEDGTMSVSQPDGNAYAESYEVDGDTLTIESPAEAPHDCPSTEGVYTFVEDGDSVTFTLVADTCQDRERDMTSGAWTKDAEDED